MAPPTRKDNCLVERAAPKQPFSDMDDCVSTFRQLEIGDNTKPPFNSNKENIHETSEKTAKNEAVVGNAQRNSVQKSRAKNRSGRVEPTSPTEFFHMGSLKSHAMAGKTQTASKLAANGSQLMADLLAKGSLEPENQKQKEMDSCTENADKVSSSVAEDEDLIGRGPVRASRTVPTSAPYAQIREQQLHLRNGIPPQLANPPLQHWQSQKNRAKPNYVQQQEQSPSFGYNGFQNENRQCGDTRNGHLDDQQVTMASGGDLFNEGYAVHSFALHPGYNQSLSSPTPTNYSPCSVRDDFTPPCSTYISGNTEQGKVAVNPFADGFLNTDELSRLLNVPEELPEALSDFILKYSRRYSTDTPPSSSCTPDSTDGSQPSSRKNSASDSSTSSGSPRHCVGFRPRSSTDEGSVCDSPMSAGSASQKSPAAPKGAQTPGTPTSLKQLVGAPVNRANGRYKPILPKQLQSSRKGKARDRLLGMFSESQKAAAWIWALKVTQSCPGALYYRDPDGDSLLHIVVWHRDLSKVYALVEQMLKTEYTPCRKPFDLPNRLHETPLFLAVEKRAEEVVSYLLECGANPNYQTRRAEMDAPLHYAAARGMAEIVQTLCSAPNTDKNLRNGLGLTPLLCAVKNHGVIEEESQCLVNNKPTIRALLKTGSDPKIPDATNGKTVIHYSVERMDPELVEIFRDNLDKEEMRQLVALPSYSGETVVHLLGRMHTGPRTGTGLGRFEAEDELRRKMFLTLVSCGAQVTPSGDDVSSEVSTEDPTSPFTAIDN